jgi:hypothetical protein
VYLEGGDYGPPDIHTVTPDGGGERDWGTVPSVSLGGWTPDGRVIFNGALFLRLETGERVELPDVSEVGPFSPDGRYMLATIQVPRTPANPLTNHPNPDFAVGLIDLSNESRQQFGFQDRDVRPLRWIDDQTFLVGARKLPFNPYLPMDCQEWAVKVSDISQRSLVSNECRDGYVSRDGRYVYFVRVRDPGNFPRVGDLYRLDLSDGSETLWMSDAMSVQIYEPAPGSILSSPTAP